ncbi:hypothetical protein [Methanobrevibacter sp.]
MDRLIEELNDLNRDISELENRISQAKIEAKSNIEPLEAELENVRRDKREFGFKNDFEAVQSCKRRENNLKFKINSQWNRYSILKGELYKLKVAKRNLEAQIRLERDKIKRRDEIKARMDIVLDNYEKTGNLTQSAIDSKISPENVHQWFDWGKNDYSEEYSYFYGRIREIDNHFMELEAQKLKKQMDDVADAYSKTASLEKAAEIAHVSYDTVQYWYEWGSKGFGKENTYFFKRIDSIQK